MQSGDFDSKTFKLVIFEVLPNTVEHENLLNATKLGDTSDNENLPNATKYRQKTATNCNLNCG